MYNKLIIEYDGTYWHKNKDKEDGAKTTLALENGYIVFRVKECDAHRTETLLKIKEVIDEIKKNRENKNKTL